MKHVAIDSEAIDSLGYDLDAGVLEVRFHGGRLYRYRQVPPAAVLELLEAESIGQHFNQVFKAAGYPYEALDEGGPPSG
nr:KTSC domain-containing protein [Stutzerimonas azotifigens]